MEKNTLELAIALQKRITHLEILKYHLKPSICNGVGVCGTTNMSQVVTYRYNFWSTNRDNMHDNDLIMRAGIKAMHDEVCRLLTIAEKDLKLL